MHPKTKLLRRVRSAQPATNLHQLKAFTLTELMVVLVIIGVIMLIALPVFDDLFGDAYSLEAKNQLVYLHAREEGHRQQSFTYSDDLRAIGYTQPETVEEGGTARYVYEVISASKQEYIARATAIADFDGDGIINVWEIDTKGVPVEVVPD